MCTGVIGILLKCSFWFHRSEGCVLVEISAFPASSKMLLAWGTSRCISFPGLLSLLQSGIVPRGSCLSCLRSFKDVRSHILQEGPHLGLSDISSSPDWAHAAWAGMSQDKAVLGWVHQRAQDVSASHHLIMWLDISARFLHHKNHQGPLIINYYFVGKYF